MERQNLINVIQRVGGQQSGLAESDALWRKIDFLQQTNRYSQLIKQLTKANDRSNFLALLLEINFAFQFESRGLELRYEVKQNSQRQSSIDFLRQTSNGDQIYLELRLLQQTKTFTDWIKKQLERFQAYVADLKSIDEQNEIVRIQSTVLSKVQDRKGNPIKFFTTATNAVNIVAIDATDSLLKTIDIHDCMLATHGDPSVEEQFRRGVFGLFQKVKTDDSKESQDLAAKYKHIRNTLHGVLFLFKVPNTGDLAYELECFLISNPVLISTDRAAVAFEEIVRTIPRRN
ncbi:hypothetical protein [Microbulbifer epialgicus]|uniref:Uncharacterized protein n=1 Tax=Microbulbifer epialgicus TaxID=393907 RepID=A0ABV4P4K6_9GAMM